MLKPNHTNRFKLLLIFWLPLLIASLAGPFFWPDHVSYLLLACGLVVLFSSQLKSPWLRRLWHFLLIMIYLSALFFVLFKALLYDFTGQGFTTEVYYHLSWESFKVGFDEYRWQLILLFIVMLGFMLLIERISHQGTERVSVLSGLLAKVMLLAGLFFAPTGQFLQGLYMFSHAPAISSVNEQQLKPYIDAGFINPPIMPKKNQVVASTQQNKNLILIYLESFNRFFIDHPDHSYLTPRLQQLGDRFFTFQHENSSSVTIEGLISSQCGTLLPMTAGNDTFMKKSNTMEQLPCLGDVLSVAGYEQYYLGGAKLEFAGKGDFLKSHGYDHVWGIEHWQNQGKRSPKNVWGLSDSELFEEAYKVIEEAANNPPYHLTLLTLGTHIPGYTYAGCEAIDHQDRFLDAIACTDVLVSQFIEKLEHNQLLDNTLVVIVADHGVFPNSKMQALFGDLVHDKRLVGITNHRPVSEDTPISTYDLAPTILEWLGIEHNAVFLYGQSLKKQVDNPHPNITRYRDWLNGQIHKNPPSKDCQQPVASDQLLNRCQKQYLLGVTNHILNQYNQHQSGPELACELRIAVDLAAEEKTLLINGLNRYDQFHYGGYNLNSRQYDTGHFGFALNEHWQMINTDYQKLASEVSMEPVFVRNEQTDTQYISLEIIVHQQQHKTNNRLLVQRPGMPVTNHALTDEITLNLCDN